MLSKLKKYILRIIFVRNLDKREESQKFYAHKTCDIIFNNHFMMLSLCITSFVSISKEFSLW